MIYEGLEESKDHLFSNQERDERGMVVKFPAELDLSIKGAGRGKAGGCHCFTETRRREVVFNAVGVSENHLLS